MPARFGLALAQQGLRLFEPRHASRVLVGLLGVYALGFMLFYPATVTVTDEGTYIRQAQLMLQGSVSIELEDPLTGEPFELHPINAYPLGTALLLLPFVGLGGREAASLLSLVCVLAAVAVTGRWLKEEGYSPLWAILLLSYPATMVMGRVAMSEAPSLLVVSLGLWLTFRGFRDEGPVWLLAGFVAGLSFAFREGNVLLFAPLFLGTVLRRDAGWWRLVVGGMLGLSVRLLSAWLFFGDPFFTKPVGDEAFSLAAISNNAAIYLFSLLVLVPGGLVAAFAYRGPRRPEVIVTTVVFAMFYLSYGYNAAESGWAKRLVLAPRFFVPLLPLLALAAAEVWPRWARAVRDAAPPERRRRLEAAAGITCVLALGALAVVLLGVQAAHASWAADQARVRDAIYQHTSEGSVVVTNWKATGKFIDLVHGQRIVLRRERATRPTMRLLLERVGTFYVVLLDRTDSAFWRRESFENSFFMAQLRYPRELLFEEQLTPTDHLRIWRIGE